MKQKRKDKNQQEKDTLDELKEIKNYIAEGKTLLDRASLPSEIETALELFNKVILKANMSMQVPQISQLYHLRGLSQFKLNQFELAEKDFQEAILMSEEKSKGPFYHSLGKCKIQLAQKDPIIVLTFLFSMKRPSSAFRKSWTSAAELTGKPSSTWAWSTGK